MGSMPVGGWPQVGARGAGVEEQGGGGREGGMLVLQERWWTVGVNLEVAAGVRSRLWECRPERRQDGMSNLLSYSRPERRPDGIRMMRGVIKTMHRNQVKDEGRDQNTAP